MLHDVDVTASLISGSDTSAHEPLSLVYVAGLGCIVWYFALLLVVGIGHIQLWRYYAAPKPRAAVSTSSGAPHITIIRPVKDLEPYLYECLASTFRQDYNVKRLSIRFCVSDEHDASLPTLERLIADFPEFDAEILVETADAHLKTAALGPNPKIRNMSRAYRESKGDIVWIIDCNVWIARGTAGRMVETLQRKQGRPAKFVHLLPLTVDVTSGWTEKHSSNGNGHTGSHSRLVDQGKQEVLVRGRSPFNDLWRLGGGRLDEAFMASAHGKFYTAINTVLIAPCIVGKSTMFRKAHLDGLTGGQGIDFFSENICEDHLIGDLLWKQKVPEQLAGERWDNHAMVFGDLAVQPIADMSLGDYFARRVRWLRVRKYTVTLATLVEPGTECFLASLYGAVGSTSLGLVPSTWSVFCAFWLISVAMWCVLDRLLYVMLHSGRSIEQDKDTPPFARKTSGGPRRAFVPWLASWLGREALAFPIWAWAVYGGATVHWRGQDFWVGLDMKVHKIKEKSKRRRD